MYKRVLFAFFFVLPMVLASQPKEPEASPGPVGGGSHFNQAALKTLLDNQNDNLETLPQVFYDYYIMNGTNGLRARLQLYRDLGLNERDAYSAQGQALLELLNRKLLEDLSPGDTLVVPTQFGLDMRAYAPFPRYYPGAKDIAKLVILHKEIQGFAAYENGKLRRWGIINTGTDGSRTPEGRFNANWREQERVSTLSPPGEEWVMTWVVNFEEARGIHMHQYAMPTAGPASHGCVRLNDADAEWVYNWVDLWKKTGGSGRESGGRLIEQGTMILVLGPDPQDVPQPYIYKRRYPILRIVDLPTDPWTVKAGTEQQRIFDRKRKS